MYSGRRVWAVVLVLKGGGEGGGRRAGVRGVKAVVEKGEEE